jgi:hypothetical protein
MNINANDCKDCEIPVNYACTKADVAEHASFVDEYVCYDIED